MTMFSPARLGARAIASRYFALAFALMSLAPLAARAQDNSYISGYAFVDKNNDGMLSYSNSLMPERIIPDVEIKLYSIVGSTQTLLQTAFTDALGQYKFSNLAPGMYGVQEVQPLTFIDGLNELGVMHTLGGAPNPAGSAVGALSQTLPDFFTGILLPADARGELYNFGELGLAPQAVSKRQLFVSAPPPVFAPPPTFLPEPASGALAMMASVALAAAKRCRSARTARRRRPA